ncbi:MAG: DUF3329 domain-containing protein [Paracoccaceae bacterium]
MKFFDFHDPFFNPLWIRITLFAICIGWAVFEFATGSPFWGILFGATGLAAGWKFFIDRPGGGA